MDISEMLGGRYLKAANIPNPTEVVIAKAGIEEIPEKDGKPKAKVVVYFVGKEKGLVMNQTNMTTLKNLFGTETDDWIGKRVILRSERVQYGRDMVDALRLVQIPTPVPAGKPSKKNGDDDVPF